MRRQIALRIRCGKCIYFKRHIDEPFLNTIFTIDQNGANAHTHTCDICRCRRIDLFFPLLLRARRLAAMLKLKSINMVYVNNDLGFRCDYNANQE